MKTITKSETQEFILSALMPDAPSSRLRVAERALNSMTDKQLSQTMQAVLVAIKERSMSRIRDIVESRDLISIAAISRWGKMIPVSAIEGELNARFSILDHSYDIYSTVFEAHVEAYATYHSNCNNCIPHDIEVDYTEIDGMTAPPTGHYVDYLQDHDLMEAVEENPDRVSELVKLASERRGLNKELWKDHLESDASALSSGLL